MGQRRTRRRQLARRVRTTVDERLVAHRSRATCGGVHRSLHSRVSTYARGIQHRIVARIIPIDADGSETATTLTNAMFQFRGTQPFATTTTVERRGRGLIRKHSKRPRRTRASQTKVPFLGEECWLKSRIHVVNLFFSLDK